MSYSEKLKDPRWQKVRLAVLSRDKWKCILCGDAQNTLHVHHNTYSGNPWDVDITELETLCLHCHAAIGHKLLTKGYIIDKAIKKPFPTFIQIFLRLENEEGNFRAAVMEVDPNGTNAKLICAFDISLLTKLFPEWHEYVR